MREIVSKFRFEGLIEEIRPVGNGWINDTYKVVTSDVDTPDYILQRINNYVFRDVDALQHNIEIITSHIRSKLLSEGETDTDRKVLRFIESKDGKLYHFDGESYWRMMVYIADSVTYETVNAELAEIAGREFGRYQSMLSDLDASALVETIPNFHNIEFRIENFKAAVQRDSEGRLNEVRDLVDELLARSQQMCLAEQLYRQGKLPKRVTHCDTKVNNILFDKYGQPLCIIDLDTTMPGFVLSDFGDFIRTGANTGAEDDDDLDKIDVNMEIFEAFSRGYIAGSRTFLTSAERNMLTFGVKMLTYMQTLRFLTDYLEGDKYYKIKSQKHNLQRSRAQFKLLLSIEDRETSMNQIISRI